MATLGTEKKWPMWRGGRCRESEARVNVWTVRRNKNGRCSEAGTRMNVWTVRRNKNGRCREVAVVESLKQE